MRQTYTSLDRVLNANQDISLIEPVCIEPTVSGTRYLFPIDGKVSEAELENAAYEDENTDSSGEEVTSDEETETHITTARANVFPKIVFFGTGSTYPGVTKTTTAILVHTA